MNSTTRFAKGPVMHFMSRTSARACPLALILATMPVMAQELDLNPALAPAAMPATMPATEPATQPAATTEPTTMPATTQSSEATTQPAEATTQPAIPAPAVTRPYDPDARVSFNFKEASIDGVLDYLSEYLGFIVIKDGPVSGRVTMTSRQAIGASDAVDLLNSSLKPVGYTAIQTGRALRVVSRDKAKRANIPVHMGADPKQIKNSDELITQVIPLGQLDATKLRTDLQALYSAEADVTSNAGSNTIIITDSSANIRRLVEIIASMDRQLASTADIKVFQLEYASATNAARLINELFKTDQTSQQQGARGAFGGMGAFPAFGGRGGAGGFPGGGVAPGGAAAAGGSDSGVRSAGKVAASADDRTNTLVVTGPTATLEVIAGVVKELDSNPSQTSTVFVYRIRNGQAQHMQDVLNTLFGTSGSSGSRTTSTGTQQTRQPFGGMSFGSNSSSGASSSSRGMTGNTSSNRGSTGNTSTASRTGSTGFGGSGGGTLSAAARAAAGDLAGQVYVVADLDTNSLIITTNPKYLDQVKTILADLDRAIPQVLIKVLFAEVTHTNASDLGFEMMYSGTNGSVGTNFGLANANSGMNVAYVNGDFTAKLHALAAEGKVDVLSRPYILASDNQLASILVGQQVPFITYSQLTDTGQTNNTFQYQDIGIILNVTPHINPDGKVIMDVSPEISALVPDTTVQVSSTVSLPVFSKRSAQSRVAIDNGKTIVIGGLMEDKKNSIVTKVPWLGDIPYVGNLFRRTITNTSKTELLIFLTPHVAMESTALKAMSQDEVNGTKIVPDAVAPGVFQEHIEGMQRGATTQPSEPLHVRPSKPAKPPLY